ncbi:Tuberous sclerosis 2-like protein [Malassezia sp. CBS 17886]|nr:Tuberous sclerosis 2-like protein [Malassezia sp. CBS 17886]
MDGDSGKGTVASKAPLGVPFLRSLRARSSTASSAAAGVDDARPDARIPAVLAGGEIRAAMEALQAPRTSAAEQLAHARFITETLRSETAKGGAVLAYATGTPLVTSLTVLCVRVLRSRESALELRLLMCELITATLRYIDACMAHAPGDAFGKRDARAELRTPADALSSLDRALLFRLVVALRDPADWALPAITSEPTRAYRTLVPQLQAVQALTREGRDILPYRHVLAVLSEWLTQSWGCMLMLRAQVAAGAVNEAARSALLVSEQCTHSLLLMLAAVFKFNAARIAMQQIQNVLEKVAALVLRPQIPRARPRAAASPPERAQQLDNGFSYYGLESMSPFFNTPATGPVDTASALPDSARQSPRAASVDDAEFPELTASDVQAVACVLEAAICYALIPTSCMESVVCMVCRIMGLPTVRAPLETLLRLMEHPREGAQGELWSVHGNLLRSHCANTVLRTVCGLLSDAVPLSGRRVPQSVLVGAMLFLHASLLWTVGHREESGRHARGGARDDSAMTALSFPVVEAAVQGAMEKRIDTLDLATVLFLDAYLPARLAAETRPVDASVAPRTRASSAPLCTLFREYGTQADWDLLQEVAHVARRHMQRQASVRGRVPTRETRISSMVLHIVVDMLAGTPAAEEREGAWTRAVVTMPSLASLFWPLAPLLPDAVLVEMVQQNRAQNVYVPSSTGWVASTMELVDTFYPAGAGADAAPPAALATATQARLEVVEMVCNLYEMMQDMPTYRGQLMEGIVVPLLERALPTETATEANAMLHRIVRHAATIAALDPGMAGGTLFQRLCCVLVQNVRSAAVPPGAQDGRHAIAQHSRQRSVGPSSSDRVRETHIRVTRAQSAVADLFAVFHQLAFALPNASLMAHLDVVADADVQANARAASIAVFRELLLLVQQNTALDLPAGPPSAVPPSADARARVTLCIPAQVRLMILQWLMRLRVDRLHRIYFVHELDPETVRLAQLLRRGAPAEAADRDERPDRDERAARAHMRLRREERGAGDRRAHSRIRGASTERRRANSDAARGPPERDAGPGVSGASGGSAGDAASQLWSVPETLDFELPDVEWPSTVLHVYAYGAGGGASEGGGGGGGGDGGAGTGVGAEPRGGGGGGGESAPRALSPPTDAGESTPTPTAAPAAKPALLATSEYLAALTALLQSEEDWEVVSYILTHLPAQLANKHLFCGPATEREICALHGVVCPVILQQRQFASLVLPDDVRKTDMYAVLYSTLRILTSYGELLSRAQQDELVETFIMGLTKSQNTAQPCVRALVLACYELQKSFTRLAPRIMMKLSTIMSSMTMSVHILELMAEVSTRPTLYANFTEADYKRVFGIALQYIQYHGSGVAAVREDIRSSPARFSLSQYVMMLAYSNIAQWFITLRLGDRAKHVPYITRGLMLANEGRDSLSDQTYVCLDFLARFTYSNAEAKPSPSLVRFLVTDEASSAALRPGAISPYSQTWCQGRTLITITPLQRNGWTEVTARRPSGTTSIVLKLENLSSETLANEERMVGVIPTLLSKARAMRRPSRVAHVSRPGGGGAADDGADVAEERGAAEGAGTAGADAAGAEGTAAAPTPAPGDRPASPPPAPGETGAPKDGADAAEDTGAAPRQRARDGAVMPAYFMLQLSTYPDISVEEAPLLLPAGPATDRMLRAVDLTPVYDFHKIGVLYVGHGQHTEKDILSNTTGSQAYTRFLGELGDLIALRGQQDVYTGGLDRQTDEHGKYAYVWTDSIKQIVFQTASLMPNRDTDPTCGAKKALIGNTFVHIVFNESDRAYRFGTIPSQFNFVNIVVSPHSRLFQGRNDEDVDDTVFFRVELQKREGLPDFSPVGDGQLVSFGSLTKFVRNLAMHCDLMSQIFLDTGESMVPYTSTDWVTRLQHIERYRAQQEARKAEADEGHDDDPMDQRDFTRAMH